MEKASGRIKKLKEGRAENERGQRSDGPTKADEIFKDTETKGDGEEEALSRQINSPSVRPPAYTHTHIATHKTHTRNEPTKIASRKILIQRLKTHKCECGNYGTPNRNARRLSFAGLEIINTLEMIQLRFWDKNVQTRTVEEAT